MPHLVILRHDDHALRGLHWDLMLEAGSVLWTWALPAEPVPGRALLGERIADHRLLYLTFEGPIAGDRGRVTRCFASEFDWQTQTEQQLVIRLAGDGGQLQMALVDPVTASWKIRWLHHTEMGSTA